jgi:hypothetical protein
MTDELSCWKCGASLEGLPLPLGRRAECLACRAELHVCRMCRFYDPHIARACREPVAEEVQDKERANFCDHFEARAGAFIARDDAAARSARTQLDALFGTSKTKES